MRKQLLLTVAALTLTATGVWAADSTPKAGNSTTNTPPAQAENAAKSDTNKDWTLDHARKYAHLKAKKAQEYADKLDKMTESEWAEREKKWHAFKAKFAKMKDEEKKKYWDNRKKRHEAEMDEAGYESAEKTTGGFEKH